MHGNRPRQQTVILREIQVWRYNSVWEYWYHKLETFNQIIIAVFERSNTL
jgi:hypothetical protein